MRWVLFAALGVVALVAVIALVGSMLPRAHKASRTLRVTHPPDDVWAAVNAATAASSVPVDTLESVPPYRLVTRVKESEKNFGGTWTIVVAPTPQGSALTITEDGWVANPIFRFMARYVIGHHATMDGILKQTAKALNEDAVLSGE